MFVNSGIKRVTGVSTALKGTVHAQTIAGSPIYMGPEVCSLFGILPPVLYQAKIR